MNLRTLSSTIVASVAVLTVGASQAHAIQGGVVDFDQTVVSIFNYSRSESSVTFACTGVLIARDLVLTAAHCGLKGPQLQTPLTDDDIRFVYFGRETRDDRILSIFTSPKLSFKGNSLVRYSLPSMIRVNPDYRGLTPEGSLHEGVQHDAAIFKLNEAVPVEPAQLYTGDISSGLKTTVFGFGPTSENDLKHRLVMRSLKTSVTAFDPETQQYEIKSSRSAGLIHGDSGGPAFTGGRLWGINSSSMKGAESHVEPLGPIFNWIHDASADLTK